MRVKCPIPDWEVAKKSFTFFGEPSRTENRSLRRWTEPNRTDEPIGSNRRTGGSFGSSVWTGIFGFCQFFLRFLIVFEIASSNMNEISIFTFSSRSNRINSRVLLSRNVAESHFCVQHAGHATKFLSCRTKNWTIYRHIWHLEPKTNRIGSSVQPSVRAHFETGNRTDFRFGSLFSLMISISHLDASS